MRRLKVCGATWIAVGLAAVGSANAQTIYPINRADILSGSRFDFKVELPGAPAAGQVRVTLNGQDPSAVLGKPAEFVVNEDGGDHSAFWIRQAEVKSPGRYVIEVQLGEAKTSVTWNVFDTPTRRAKNVVLVVGDGMTVAHRTAARMLSKGLKEGTYGGELAMDAMPNMALVSTAGTDSIITDSANAMSAFTTGHKSCVNAMGVYCARNKSTLDHPKVETIAELAKRKLGIAIGVVTNTEIEDATPAGVVAHTRRRSDYNEIVGMYFASQPEVMLGGGTPNFLPVSAGGKRADNMDYIEKFQTAGYKYATTLKEMQGAVDGGASKLLGLFNNGNIDGALDRFVLRKGTVGRYPDQPDLVDQVKAALAVLAKNDKGFFLMIESGRIDKFAHSLDWERSVYDTIMLDNAVQVVKDFAGNRDDTLIIVVPDHAHPASIIGTYDDDKPGQLLRDKLGIYADAGFPSYPTANASGYPTGVDAQRRLAFVFAAAPDHCATGRPALEGEFQPVVPGPDGKTFRANEKYCTPNAVRVTGNLPFTANSGVHSGEDVIATAMGPGAELVRGHMHNTAIFRVMAIALGLAK